MSSTNLINALKSIPLIFLVSNNFLTVTVVDGRPTGSDDDRMNSSLVLVDRFSVKYGDFSFRKGDKVVMCDPYDPKKRVLRKIVVSSNDWVSMMDEGSPAIVFVPRGYCWVENISPQTWDSSELDSRDYGPVPLGLIEGFAVTSALPWGLSSALNSGLHRLSHLFGGPKKTP